MHHDANPIGNIHPNFYPNTHQNAYDIPDSYLLGRALDGLWSQRWWGWKPQHHDDGSGCGDGDRETGGNIYLDLLFSAKSCRRFLRFLGLQW